MRRFISELLRGIASRLYRLARCIHHVPMNLPKIRWVTVPIMLAGRFCEFKVPIEEGEDAMTLGGKVHDEVVSWQRAFEENDLAIKTLHRTPSIDEVTDKLPLCVCGHERSSHIGFFDFCRAPHFKHGYCQCRGWKVAA